jgi:Immunity protein 53
MIASTSLQELQDWYRSQCDDEWEHSFGVKIDTLDNPGWAVTIDLRETHLQDKSFPPRSYGAIADNLAESEDWIDCKVEEKKFKGAGGPGKLEEILATFLAWAKTSA